MEGFIINNFLNTTNLGSRSGKPYREIIDLQLTGYSEAKIITDPHPQTGFTRLSENFALETPALPLKPLHQPLQPLLPSTLAWKGLRNPDWVT